MSEPIFLGLGSKPVYLLPKYANRHGLITGATGTGKTVTLQVIAEAFSSRGVPVFLADIKGDLTGMCQPGGGNEKLEARAAEIGLSPYEYVGFPVIWWDLFGEKGHPIRATISEMGPLLLARLLNLNEVQEGVLNIAFKYADDNGLLLLDLKDLRALMVHVAENSQSIQRQYGTVSSTSVGAVQRALLVLEQQGGEMFFGEPALDLYDFQRVAPDGRGFVNILAADKLMSNPRLYSTFLLWLLSELFESMPEVGDLEKPKLVFFFDEAHLLFNDAPKALVEKIEQVVRLIRSKGVGVYFVTQNPIDVPDTVLAQLGNRVQHALRAFTPRDQRAVRVAAETFRVNPNFSTEQAITELKVGEALVSCLEEGGAPMVVERTLIRPPSSKLGIGDAEAISAARNASPFGGRYDHPVDRQSAYEMLKEAAEKRARLVEAEAAASAAEKERVAREKEVARTQRAPGRRRSDSVVEAAAKSVIRSAGSQFGRQIVRGILGGIFGKKR
jgi:DNA helicase HerA-like ATPase